MKTFFLLALLASRCLAGSATGKAYYFADNSCDTEFVEAYYAKKNCVFKGDQSECENLAILNKWGVAAAGVGAGAVAGKIFDSSHKKGPTFESKLKDFLKKSKRITEYQMDAVERYIDSGPNNSNPNRPRLTGDDLHREHERIIKELADKNPDPLRRAALRATLGPEHGWVYAKVKMAEEAAKIFPELKPLEASFRVLYEKWSEPGKKDISKLMSEHRNRVAKMFQDNPELRLITRFVSSGDLAASRLPFGSAYLREFYERFPDAKKFITEERLKGAAETGGRVAKGVGNGLIVAAAIDQTGAFLKQKYISYYLDQCSAQLGLSKAEATLLGEYNVLSDQNVKYLGQQFVNLDCRKINFSMSKEDLLEVASKQGGVPKGICKMMKTESAQIDKLLDPKKVGSTDCKNNSFLSVRKMGPFEVNQFTSRGQTYGWNAEINWPYTMNLNKITARNDLLCSVGPDHGKEENFECAQKQIVDCYNRSGPICEWTKDAASARMVNSLIKVLCSSTEDDYSQDQVAQPKGDAIPNSSMTTQ